MLGLDYGDPSYLLPSPLPLSQTLEVVAIKQISLKSAPDHLSSIRQKEIEILKVLYSLTVYLPCTSEVTFFSPFSQEVKHTNVVQLLDYHVSHTTRSRDL